MKQPPKIKLLNCNQEILETILVSDEALSQLLKIKIAKYWATFGNHPFEQSLDNIQHNPRDKKWYIYLLIESNIETLIGNGGFKGPPDQHGMVEIGYEIAQDYQNKGYATKMVSALIQIAFSDKLVQKIIAHTLEKENASSKVLLKSGFIYQTSFIDPDDGQVFKWELQKQ